ncbi:ABC transporter ATP-binding protein [Clostridium sp. P21]|uniref:ABC transporter ATP-binding protein n=1 Tax=Clostridium muellerianum TaxID=2716538 RepID=A0A7Y0HP77_9CLOT|nr:ABC transporter ATP-binding protein [Clostridium muellerianum]NMM64724.1 ABC transporter ATP-binding protein [Clostridium muellerianum]
MAGLKIENLYKSFDINGTKVNALTNINLSVEDGSFVTVIGKSGCGKTTLLRIICGLEEQTEGSVSFIYKEGIPSEMHSKKKVGIVFQEPRLMPWLTVKENMAFPLIKNKDRIEVYDTVNKYLNMLGLEKFKEAYPSQISGGMAQRVSLGRTLCYNPEIILMDEPLGALDAFNRRKLQREFINIFLENKKTIIFVTHDVDEAVYLGQKIVVMDKGFIIKEQSVDMDYYRNSSCSKFLQIRDSMLKEFSI